MYTFIVKFIIIVGVFISAGLQRRQQVAGLCGGGVEQDLTS
jgi:hypothetical protein